MIAQNSEVYNPPTEIDLFPYTCTYNEKRYVGDCILHCFVRSSLPCYLTFCRSGIPTSCYIFNVFYYLFMYIFFSSRRMLELKFAVTEQKSATS